MGKEAYRILGVDAAQEEKNYITDLKISDSFKTRISELVNSIRTTLENKEISEPEKLIKIDDAIQKMIACILSYMKVMSQQQRKDYGSGKVSDVEDDLEKMKKNLEKTLRIDSSVGGVSCKSNAYQVLKLTPHAISDKKVLSQTLMLIRMATRIKLPSNIEEIAENVFMMQRYIWAYSKINTSAKREEYKIALMYQDLQEESRKSGAMLGELCIKKGEKPVIVPLHQTEQGENFSIGITGKLVNRMIYLVEGQINQYVLVRNVNGKEGRAILYSNIDIERLQKDPQYAEFVRKMLFSSKNTIHYAKKYLGGYVGEIKSEMIINENGEEEEDLTVVYNPKHIAMCKRYGNEREAKRNPNAPQGDTQGDSGGR